ncbi:MAG: hypothetical protein KGZ63_09565 [Clostridiales bacterium]|jgi:hypothetical protein|nr:hypothetical protein [Clostridiales bacterium]
MEKTYDDILFDEYGQSVPLTADEFTEYLLDNLHQLRYKCDRLEKQLANIRCILNDQQPGEDISINNF